MTKEECLKALQGYKDLFELHQIDYYVPEKRRKKFLNNFKCIENLIDEHFDNPPLKFEELKEEIWIWDNKEKTYIKSCNNYDTKEHGKGIRVQIGFDLVRINYEENRFYRKQVEDE